MPYLVIEIDHGRVSIYWSMLLYLQDYLHSMTRLQHSWLLPDWLHDFDSRRLITYIPQEDVEFVLANSPAYLDGGHAITTWALLKCALPSCSNVLCTEREYEAGQCGEHEYFYTALMFCTIQ
jgi:hypothetical protein